MIKTVVFGGTFNPFHFGHLKLIEETIRAVSPDRFILMPNHVPPHKVEEALAPDEDRLEMCRLAAEYVGGIEVSDFEIKAGGKSFTVLTLEHLHSLYPDEKLYFAMGSDSFIGFLKWWQPERILQLATLVCNCRDDNERSSCDAVCAKIQEMCGSCILTSCEPLVCSSTDIRQRIAGNLPIDDFVPEKIEEYIVKRGLYRG